MTMGRPQLGPSLRATAIAVAETLFADPPQAAGAGSASPAAPDSGRAETPAVGTGPGGVEGEEAGRALAVTDALEAFLSAAGPGTRRLYRLLLRVVAWVAPLLIFRLPGFVRLRPALRARALERLEAGPLAGVMWGLKAILCTAYWESAGPAAEIGFDGRCLLDVAKDSSLSAQSAQVTASSIVGASAQEEPA